MELNAIERATDCVVRMLQARAALQSILREKYYRVVKGQADYIKEKMAIERKTPIGVMCDLAEQTYDTMDVLILLSAALEIVEEEARGREFSDVAP